MVEVIANSLEDALIDGLSFKLATTASYITSRKSCTYHPQSSNIYTPLNGTKLIKININCSDWLDPSTFRIMFDLYNTNNNMANRLRPIGGPWSFFSRMRILASGQILEDIDLYNKAHEMFNNFTSEGSRYNDYSEGFENVWEGVKYPSALNGVVNNGSAVSTEYLPGIPGAQYQPVRFKPLSGILNQQEYLPLRVMPITIELSWFMIR
jgi:hypothetical protein